MMKTVLRTLFLSGLSVIAAKSFGQSYYPAGLGNANLSLWLTAADPTTLKNPSNAQAANGNALATWTDKSGSGANATQAASGFAPNVAPTTQASSESISSRFALTRRTSASPGVVVRMDEMGDRTDVSIIRTGSR